MIDLRRPVDCPAAQLVEGLDVHELDSDQHVKANADGNFHIPVDDTTTSARLRIAEDRTDLRTSLVGVDLATNDDLVVPVITQTLWDSYVTAVHLPPDDPTKATVFVSFPAPGANIGSAQVDGATQVYFNQGDSFVWDVMPPGDQTIVFMALDVPVDTGTATVNIIGRDDRTYSATTPVEAGAISWVRLAL